MFTNFILYFFLMFNYFTYSYIIYIINIFLFYMCIYLILILSERKVMSVQRRKGPYLRGLLGFLQPFADGLKLLIKEIIIPSNSNFFIFFLSFVIKFFFTVFIFFILPFFPVYSVLECHFSIFFLLAILSLSVYGIIFLGWSSNSKYAGSICSASQITFYEIYNFTISSYRFHLSNNKLMFSSTKRYYSNEPKKIKCIIKKRKLRSWGLIEDFKYDKVLNVFDSHFSVDEKNIIFEGFLKECHFFFASEIDDMRDASEYLDGVFCKTENLNHYLFYLNNQDGISLNIPDIFLGSILILEIKKIKIVYKKKTFYCYYVFFLKEGDGNFDVYIRRISEVELDDKLILTLDCDILVCIYFPPYEVLKDSFSSKKDYDSFIKSSGKIIFDFDEIINLDELVENFLTVSDREHMIYTNYLNKPN